MVLYLFATLAWVAVGVSDDDTCGSDGAASSSCLLQNTHALQGSLFGNNMGMVARHSYEDVSLFEMGSSVDSRVAMVSSMLYKSQTRCKQMQAHQFLVSRTTQGLENHLLQLAEAFAAVKPKIKTRRFAKPLHAVELDEDKPFHAVELDEDERSGRENAMKTRASAHIHAVERDEDGRSGGDNRVNARGSAHVKPIEKIEEDDETQSSDEDSSIKARPEQVVKSTEKAVETDETENADGEPPIHARTVALSEQDPQDSKDDSAKKSEQASQLDKLVDDFIKSQSGSDDACHSKLFEARHQLNQLQDILTTLVTQVNSTETSLILYDKQLQEKLRELQEIEFWRIGELKKCKIKKEADKKMLITLQAELKEMHQIASPATAMNMANGTVDEQASQTKLSFLQVHADAMTRSLSLLQEDASFRNPREAAANIPALVQSTQDAAHHFLLCAAGHETSSSLLQEAPAGHEERGSLFQEGQKPEVKAEGNVIDLNWKAPKDPKPEPKKEPKKDETYETSQGNASSSEYCQEQKQALEITYVKAYVELSRLVVEYTDLVKSTACEDTVNANFEERAPPLQESAEKLSKLSAETADELKELRPRLESTVEADKKLRKQVADLTGECDGLPETISDLDKVRDAIRALSLCPGLQRPDFKMPKFVGKWVEFSQDAARQDDKQQDEVMNWACNHKFEGSRAAETSEIQERTVLDMPINNTGQFPLMGGCPNCAGEDGKQFKSGHSRICWFRGQPLNEDGIRGDCATGRKVVMCVTDGESMRKIAGEQ